MKKLFFLIAVLIVFLFILLTIPKINAQPGWISQDIGTNDFVAISFINQNTGYIFCIDGWIYKTTNKGQNWIQSMKYNFQGITNPVVHGIAITDSIFMVISGQAYFGGGFLSRRTVTPGSIQILHLLYPGSIYSDGCSLLITQQYLYAVHKQAPRVIYGWIR